MKLVTRFELAPFAAPANATVVYSSLSSYNAASAGTLQGVTGTNQGNPGGEIYSLFNLGTSASISLIDLVSQGGFSSVDPFDAVISIYSVTSQRPDATLFTQNVTFASPVIFGGGFNSFSTSVTAPSLTGGAYFLGVRGNPVSFHPLWQNAASNFTLRGNGGGGVGNFYDTGFNGFGGLAFQLSANATGAVPEPATWAMMIAGFGMIGGTMRRRSVKIAFA